MKTLILILTVTLTIDCFAQKVASTDMALIPAGEFIMGMDSEGNKSDFSPAHKVFVDSFYIDINEVSNGDYLKYCKITGYKLPEFWNVDIFHSGESYLDYPVVGISWVDAEKYAEWAGKRLPTEAEWEYAARGGLINNEFPNGTTWETALRRNEVTGDWENLTVKIKSFKPNGYGLYDMGGNAWEWVQDIYQHNYYEKSPVNNPRGPEKGTNRVIRSGSWHSGEMCHKVYYRKGLTANWVDFAVGFRCAKDVK